MSITLQFVFEIDGAATDVTSVVLSDATGTYGVKRNDTDAVVVADGTAMTNVATGTYEYTFTPPADNLSYTWVAEYVYDGVTYRSIETYTDSTTVVTTTEVKENLRITGTDDDMMISRFIEAATDWCQKYQRRKYLTATCVQYFDEWPTIIRPRWSPLIAVTSITYVDTAGATQTWAAGERVVDATTIPGRIQPGYSYSYPSLRGDQNGITLTYTAGYGVSASDTPEEIRTAILLLIGHLYRNREATLETSLNLSEIPFGVRALLDMERVYEV